MDLKLKNKRALVTGSTAGIGYAIAAGLAREGASVIVNGRSQARVDSALDRIRAAAPGVKAQGVEADVTTSAGAAALLAQVPDVDILVNNVGQSLNRPFWEASDADWMQQFEMNVLSGVRLARHYGAGMKQRAWGRIIFISSQAAYNVSADAIHYGATKLAQVAVARGLAVELKETGVTVNSILIGPTLTENSIERRTRMAAEQGKTLAEIEQDFFVGGRASSLLRRFASAEETATLAVFLAGEGSATITGASLRNEGGMIAVP